MLPVFSETSQSADYRLPPANELYIGIRSQRYDLIDAAFCRKNFAAASVRSVCTVFFTGFTVSIRLPVGSVSGTVSLRCIIGNLRHYGSIRIFCAAPAAGRRFLHSAGCSGCFGTEEPSEVTVTEIVWLASVYCRMLPVTVIFVVPAETPRIVSVPLA